VGLDRTVGGTPSVRETQAAETVSSEGSKQDQNWKSTGNSAVKIVANPVPQIAWKCQQRGNTNEECQQRATNIAEQQTT